MIGLGAIQIGSNNPKDPSGSALGSGLPIHIGMIGECNPQLALTLLDSGRAPGGWVDTGGWEIINVKGVFNDVTANQGVPGIFQGLVEIDFWVQKVSYTVRRPNAFAGSIFKAQSDVYNALNPNIDFQLIIKNYCEYVISPDPTPLENIVMAFCNPTGLILRCSAGISANFTNKRALAADESPTEAIITLHGMRLPRDMYSRCQADAARAILIERKILRGESADGQLVTVP